MQTTRPSPSWKNGKHSDVLKNDPSSLQLLGAWIISKSIQGDQEKGHPLYFTFFSCGEMGNWYSTEKMLKRKPVKTNNWCVIFFFITFSEYTFLEQDFSSQMLNFFLTEQILKGPYNVINC